MSDRPHVELVDQPYLIPLPDPDPAIVGTDNSGEVGQPDLGQGELPNLLLVAGLGGEL